MQSAGLSNTQLAPPPPEIKVVVVGDGAVGKTCLCNVFVTRVFPETYEPTIFENHTQSMAINGKDVVLQLWDTAGQEGYANIRELSYEGTQCFVLCFSVTDSITFSNLSVWLDELRNKVPNAKILLVGTKADLRKSAGGPPPDTHSSVRYKEVPARKIRQFVGREKLNGYVETSARQGGPEVDRVFHEAIRIGLNDGSDAPDEGRPPKTDCFTLRSRIETYCNIQ